MDSIHKMRSKEEE